MRDRVSIRALTTAVLILLLVGSVMLLLPTASMAAGNTTVVWGWGSIYWGDGTAFLRRLPVRATGLTGAVAVDGGDSHSLALKNDGTAWAWGSNDYGQLGDGTTTNRTTPVQVSGLAGAVAVAGGGEHSLALKSDGTVLAWGYNAYGMLGDGTTTNRTTPVQVLGLTGVVSVGAGGWHSLALKSDGTVWGWGLNSYGQLGDGSYTTRTTPVKASSLTGIVSIAAGGLFNLALKSDGTVWAWGCNSGWELGDNTGFARDGGSAITRRNIPAQVHGRPGGTQYLSGVVAVGAGGFFGLAINSENPYATTTSITSSPNPASFWRGFLGQTVTFTATVSAVPPGTGTPGGTVTFWDVTDIYQHPRKPVALATRTLVGGKATCKIFTLCLLRVHTIIAVYNGSTNYCGSGSPELWPDILLK